MCTNILIFKPLIVHKKQRIKIELYFYFNQVFKLPKWTFKNNKPGQRLQWFEEFKKDKESYPAFKWSTSTCERAVAATIASLFLFSILK